MASETPKMMLAFVLRQCAVELGHPPDPSELAEWANHRPGFEGHYRVFGRAISVDEARLILRNPDRVVTIHPDWEERRGPVFVSEEEREPARVLEFRPQRRAR